MSSLMSVVDVGRPQLITVLAASFLSTPSLWLMFLSFVLNVAWFYIYKQGNMSAMCSSVLSVTLRYVTSNVCSHCEQQGTRPVQGILFVPRDNFERAEDAYFVSVSFKEGYMFRRYSPFPKHVSVLVCTEWLQTHTGVCVCVCVYLCMIFLK
jgi:hypothetical protein